MSEPSANGTHERGRHIVAEEASRLAKADRIRDLIAPSLPSSGARILDAGCGSGHIAQRLGTTLDQADVVGLDIADARVATAGHRFVASSGTSMPFPDGSFDAVISNHVLEHVGSRTEQRAYLNEVRRVVADDGVLYLAVPNKWRLVEAHYSLPLLSWLPQRLANAYVRLTRKGNWYDITPPTHRQLMHDLTAAGFDCTDHTPATARAALGRAPMVGTLAQRLPTWILRRVLMVVPTFVVTARPRPRA